jgi:anaphase-promoting complex subunit 6
MDPRFGPAWIAFAHSFALEKEHDQAIIAYSTSTRLFQGLVTSFLYLSNSLRLPDAKPCVSRSHLPLLFIGMEHLQLQNIAVAGDHFTSAAAICQTDPLLWNEMGVVAYTNRE